jgi:hypothetical protein
MGIIGLTCIGSAFTPMISWLTQSNTTEKHTLINPIAVEIEGQFQHPSGNFGLIAATSPISLQPYPNRKTDHILEVSERANIRNQYKDWVFVTSVTNPDKRGWIKKLNIAFPEDFTPISLPLTPFAYRKGMLHGTITPLTLPYVENTWGAKGNGLFVSGKAVGIALEYKDIIWIKKNVPDGLYDFFQYSSDQDKLEVEYKYRQ